MTKCDFCSSLAVRWRYPAKTFSVPGYTSEGDWAACDACHAIIQSGDREALLERSFTTLGAPLHLPETGAAYVKDWQRRLHDGFWENRTGEPTPEA